MDSLNSQNNTNCVKIFYSYSHSDEKYRTKLEKHLAVLRREEFISDWHDRKILPGSEWKGEIDTNLESSDIIILLVSSNFISSDYCYEREMRKALELHNSKSAIVVPIILSPCDWRASPFGKLEVLPRDGKPISTWNTRDRGWLNTVEGIKSHIKSLRKNLSTSGYSKGIRGTPNQDTKTDPYIADSEKQVRATFSEYSVREKFFFIADHKDQYNDFLKEAKEYYKTNNYPIKPLICFTHGYTEDGPTRIVDKLYLEMYNDLLPHFRGESYKPYCTPIYVEWANKLHSFNTMIDNLENQLNRGEHTISYAINSMQGGSIIIHHLVDVSNLSKEDMQIFDQYIQFWNRTSMEEQLRKRVIIFICINLREKNVFLKKHSLKRVENKIEKFISTRKTNNSSVNLLKMRSPERIESAAQLSHLTKMYISLLNVDEEELLDIIRALLKDGPLNAETLGKRLCCRVKGTSCEGNTFTCTKTPKSLKSNKSCLHIK